MSTLSLSSKNSYIVSWLYWESVCEICLDFSLCLFAYLLFFTVRAGCLLSLSACSSSACIDNSFPPCSAFSISACMTSTMLLPSAWWWSSADCKDDLLPRPTGWLSDCWITLHPLSVCWGWLILCWGWLFPRSACWTSCTECLLLSASVWDDEILLLLLLLLSACWGSICEDGRLPRSTESTTHRTTVARIPCTSSTTVNNRRGCRVCHRKGVVNVIWGSTVTPHTIPNYARKIITTSA